MSCDWLDVLWSNAWLNDAAVRRLIVNVHSRCVPSAVHILVYRCLLVEKCIILVILLTSGLVLQGNVGFH